LLQLLQSPHYTSRRGCINNYLRRTALNSKRLGRRILSRVDLDANGPPILFSFTFRTPHNGGVHGLPAKTGEFGKSRFQDPLPDRTHETPALAEVQLIGARCCLRVPQQLEVHRRKPIDKGKGWLRFIGRRRCVTNQTFTNPRQLLGIDVTHSYRFAIGLWSDYVEESDILSKEGSNLLLFHSHQPAELAVGYVFPVPLDNGKLISMSESPQ